VITKSFTVVSMHLLKNKSLFFLVCGVAMLVSLTLAGLAFAAQTLTTLAQSDARATPWLDQGRPSALAQEAVALLAQAQADGLHQDDYRVSQLTDELLALQRSGTLAPALAERFDRELTIQMTAFLHDLALGRVSAREVHHNFGDVPARQFDARAVLHRALETGDLQAAVNEARPTFPLYAALWRALEQYRALAENRAWDEALPPLVGNKLEVGQAYDGMPIVAARLVALGDLDARDAAILEPNIDSSFRYTPFLRDAVKRFQSRHGLDTDGIIGQQTLAALNVTPAQRVEQIALSMERVRWTPLQQGSRLIVVNIPGFMLYGYQIGPDHRIDIQVEMRVVIGRALNHRTPLFDEDMRFIEFSPYWNIPASIARAEVIPAIRRDPGYFARQQLEFVTPQGSILSALTDERLAAVLAGQLRIRQRPGPHNALGDIKFIFPNNQHIFIHHTPATQLFDRSRRDFSHGCIRAEDPVALAKFVLADAPEWTEARIRQAMSAGRSTTIRLAKPVPVVIAYSTVIARDGVVYFYPDIYGHDQLLAQALQRQQARRPLQ
jgi:murein L,D-transpeptidase YcbB/YkuD